MFQPIGDKLLVRPIETPKEGTIELPTNYQQPTAAGEVVRLGTWIQHDGKRFTEAKYWPCAPGNKVIFNSAMNQARKIEDDGEELFLLHVGQLLAVTE